MNARKFVRLILYSTVILGVSGGFWACNTLKYVPQDKYLLRKNEIETERSDKSAKRRERVKQSELMPYVQQRPNSRLLGMGIYLGFYNMTDTSKHRGWHRFWREKAGEAPVIHDSAENEKSKHMMTLYMQSRGYLNAQAEDSTTFKRQRATVRYTVRENQPYSVSEVRYRINDTFLEPIILEDTSNSLVRPGVIFDRNLLDAERTRIADRLQNMGFWGFDRGYISYVADSTAGEYGDHRDHKVRLTIRVRQRVATVTADGEQILENHPIYRIGQIVVNAAYNPAKSPEELEAMPWDTLSYRGVDIAYVDKLELKEHILVDAVRLSPNELFDRSSVQRTYTGIRNLQYNANILFSEMPYDTLDPIEVTRTGPDGSGSVATTERNLYCLIQCTPNVKQNFDGGLELSTTTDYYSAALSFGYQNKNIFRGAEVWSAHVRGAYELMKKEGRRNSYELGFTVGLDVPRFWLPLSADRLAKYQAQKTNLLLSYNIQRRPNYNRTIASAAYGYSWALRNGARFQINPVDLNVVSVPWVDPDFLNKIENEYLKNTYQNQIIAGLSATYHYTTNDNRNANGFTFRAYGDVNGNLLRGLNALLGRKFTENEGQTGRESYYRILGIRFAQYARLTVDISNRVNTTRTSQFAWRFLIGGGYAYGNSKVMPFDRLFFAGGSNSMRGWQVRTLGPGATPDPKKMPLTGGEGRKYYAEQLGDFRLELNAEYRFTLVGKLGMAIFADAGNVWMNAKGSASYERFRFDSFYRQIALAGGLGLRYDIGFVILRLDWGTKLYDPCTIDKADRWKSGFKLNETVLHFAIGLPF